MAIVKTKKADLNIHYKKYFQISLILTLAMLIAAFKLSPVHQIQNDYVNDEPNFIPVEKIDNTTQLTKPPLPPKPIAPVIAIDNSIEDIEFNPTDIDETEKIGPPPELTKPSSYIVEEEEPIFLTSEEMPQIIGGIESILKNVKYPEMARRLDIEGKVIVELVIGKSGEILETEIVKGVSRELDEAALNAVKLAKFTPGIQRGKPVKVRMTIPIVFKLR